jgi:LmbE family N-acetylglucosaminyl deacetylase
VRAFLEDVATRTWTKLRPVRNLLFQSRLRYDPDAPVLVLSPHLDDAVIDCWSVLTGPWPLNVVNVFAGVPPSGEVAYFDRLAGARDSALHVQRRIAEDREAVGHAGRSPVNLGFLARPYRRGRPEPSFAAVDDALVSRVGSASLVYAPAALGSPHPDHAFVRSYALALAANLMPVGLYADLPYCALYGWPTWVTGEEANLRVDVDAYWRASAADPSHPLTREGAEVVRLPGAQAEAKLAAMRMYRAEFAVLDRGPIGQLSNPVIHGYEVFWPPHRGAT